MENITFYFISPRQILLNKKRKRKKRKKAPFSLLLYSIVIPFSMLRGGVVIFHFFTLASHLIFNYKSPPQEK